MLEKIQAAVIKHKEWTEEQDRQRAEAEKRINRLKELDAMHTATAQKLKQIEDEADGHIEASERIIEGQTAGMLKIA